MSENIIHQLAQEYVENKRPQKYDFVAGLVFSPETGAVFLQETSFNGWVIPSIDTLQQDNQRVVDMAITAVNARWKIALSNGHPELHEPLVISGAKESDPKIAVCLLQVDRYSTQRLIPLATHEGRNLRLIWFNHQHQQELLDSHRLLQDLTTRIALERFVKFGQEGFAGIALR